MDVVGQTDVCRASTFIIHLRWIMNRPPLRTLYNATERCQPLSPTMQTEARSSMDLTFDATFSSECQAPENAFPQDISRQDRGIVSLVPAFSDIDVPLQ